MSQSRIGSSGGGVVGGGGCVVAGGGEVVGGGVGRIVVGGGGSVGGGAIVAGGGGAGGVDVAEGGVGGAVVAGASEGSVVAVGASVVGGVGAVDGVTHGSVVGMGAGELVGGALDAVAADGPRLLSAAGTASPGPGDPDGAASESPPSASTMAVVLAVPAVVTCVAATSSGAPRVGEATVVAVSRVEVASASSARLEPPSRSCPPPADPLAISEPLPRTSTAAMAHGLHDVRRGGQAADPAAQLARGAAAA